VNHRSTGETTEISSALKLFESCFSDLHFLMDSLGMSSVLLCANGSMLCLVLLKPQRLLANLSSSTSFDSAMKILLAWLKPIS
jgi:hypothetical protein